MPLKAPELDTRTFDDLMAEAVRRIPRYTPEWTDFNESDPGVTLLQLYAWLSELTLFQLNQVPERHYIKFLQLLGLELRPARPATAHVSFAGTRDVPVRRGTQLLAQPPEGGVPLVFETDVGLGLIRIPLERVVVFDGRAFRDVTPANAAPGTATYRPLGWVPQPGSALYLGFAPPPRRELEGRLFPQEMRFRVALPEAAGFAAECDARKCGTPPPPPPVELVWEYRAREEETRWRRLDVLLDESVAFTRDGDLLVEGPAVIEPTLAGRVREPLRWLRCRLERGGYPEGTAPEIDVLLPNTVRVTNLTTVREEVLGLSEGVPDQHFELVDTPVEAASLELAVEGRGVPEETWQRVDDFLASGPDDPHYTLNATAGRVAFGDGANGRIPTAGTEIVARCYRWGGGSAGNVPAGVIKSARTTLDEVERIVNVRPAVGGREEQSVDDLKRRAPQVLRHRNRATTAEDFAALAVEAGGVAEATALPLAHPDHPGVEVPGAVTVVVLPDHGGRPPRPTAELLEHVCRYLEDFRLLTTEVYVKGPEFIGVGVRALLRAGPRAAADSVARDAALALDGWLSPRRWRFGRDLYPTSLYDVLLEVDGVVAVESLAVEAGGRPHDGLTQPVVVPADGLVYGLDPEITVRPEEDR